MGILGSILDGTPSSSGLSAATKALLVVLAAKAAKDYLAHRQQAPQGAPSTAGASAAPQEGGLGGILGGLLGGGQQAGGAGGGLGSVLGGGGLGSILGGGGLGGLLGGLGGAGGLGALVNQFQQNGHGGAINSWIADGPNHPIAPAQLGEALGETPLQELEAHTGMPRQALLEQLSQELPAAVDHVTPEGRLPTDEEMAKTLEGHPGL